MAIAGAKHDLFGIHVSVVCLHTNGVLCENVGNFDDIVHSTLDICFCFCKVS